MKYYSDNHLSIVDLKITDLPQVLNLKPADWGDILPAFKFYLQTEYCISLIALINNKIVGTGTIIFHSNVAWLAHIMVHSEYRNQGIGAKITKTLIDLGLKKVSTILLLATDLGKPIYSSLGFQYIEDYIFFNNTSISFDLSDKIIPYSDNHRQSILNLDEMITGEKRKIFLDSHLNKSFIINNEDGIAGIYYSGFGEGLIIANDVNVGLELMKFKLLDANPMALPSSNTLAIEFLTKNGITINKAKTVYRMVYGRPIDWKPKQIFGRFGGNLG
jgi:GNAT superfamily N-acetyltransferase